MGSWRDAFDEPPPTVVWVASWALVIVLLAAAFATGVLNGIQMSLGRSDERTWWTFHGEKVLVLAAVAIVAGLFAWRHRANGLAATGGRSR